MASFVPLPEISALEADLRRVDVELGRATKSPDALLTEISCHLIAAGGRRTRSALGLAVAAVGNGDGPSTDEAVLGATSIELVHLGSQYHDDVIDDARVRGALESANVKWDSLSAILAGDFLLARASEIASSLGTEVAGCLAAAIGQLCEGRVLELSRIFDIDRTETAYLQSITGKTGALHATAARIGGLVGGLPGPAVDALTTFGERYGMAIQVVDDVLDIVCSKNRIGRGTSPSLASGNYTLPVIHALATDAGDELKSMLGSPLTGDQLDLARSLVANSGAVPSSFGVAESLADQAVEALADLPDTAAVQGLTRAAEQIVTLAAPMVAAG